MVARSGPGRVGGSRLRVVHSRAAPQSSVHSPGRTGPHVDEPGLAGDMQISPVNPVDLSDVAARLEQAAGRVEVCAVQVCIATSTTWRGEAAVLHHDRVDEHASDLRALARRLREAAGLVRDLEAAARRRIDLVGDADVTAGDWPVEVVGRG